MVNFMFCEFHFSKENKNSKEKKYLASDKLSSVWNHQQ
jgi:hypothetical protein